MDVTVLCDITTYVLSFLSYLVIGRSQVPPPVQGRGFRCGWQEMGVMGAVLGSATFEAGQECVFSLSLLSSCALSCLTRGVTPSFWPAENSTTLSGLSSSFPLLKCKEKAAGSSTLVCNSSCWGSPLTAGVWRVWHAPWQVFLGQSVAYIKDLRGDFSAFVSPGHCCS